MRKKKTWIEKMIKERTEPFRNHLTRELASKQKWEDDKYLDRLEKPDRKFNNNYKF